MAIALDTATSAKSSVAGATLTISLTVGALDNGLLAVATAVSDSNTANRPLLSVVSDLQGPLTKIAHADRGASTSERSELWYLLAPLAGTHTLTLTYTGSVDFKAATAIALGGVKQAAPHASTTATGSTDTAAASLAVTADNCWFIDALCAEPVPTLTTSGGTQRGNQEGQPYQHQASSICGPLTPVGTQTMSWSLSYGSGWCQVVAAFEPVTDNSVAKSFKVAASTDDARNNNGNSTFNGTVATQHLGLNAGVDYWNGWRFLNVTVPQGATINSAALNLYSAAVTSGTTAKAIFYGEAADNPVTFSSTTANKPEGRARTAASVAKDFTVSAWTATGFGRETVTVTTLVQEIVNRAGFASGNALALVAHDNGSTNNNYIGHSTYDSAAARAAVLTINYTAASASGATASPASQALALATQSPGISVSGAATATPSAQGLTLALTSPTISAERHATINPASLGLTLTQAAPTVAATGPIASYLLEGFEKQTARWANSGTGSFAFTTGYNSATAIRLTTPADGDINVYRTLWSAILTGFDTLELDVNFHGHTFLEAGDSPIIIFEQGDWKYARLTNFATNGVDGWQHVAIPLAKFTTNGDATPGTPGTGTALDPDVPLTAIRARVYETTGGKQLSLDNVTLKDSTGTLVEDFTQATIFSDPHTTPLAVQGGDVMKWSKDDLFSQKSDGQIAQVCAGIAALNATHLAYATPYDDPADYPDGPPTAGYDLRWITAARAAGLKVFHRRQWLTWEGIYSTTKTTEPGLGTAAAVLAGTDTTSYLARTYQFWLDHADTLVEAGDIVCPCPEPENGGIAGVTGSAPYQFADGDLFRTWLRDAITVTNAALDAHGLKGQVLVGGYGTSGFITFGNFDNPHGFLDDRTADAMGVIGMDHYPAPASQMGADLDKVRALYELPLMLTEWGTINETTDADRIAAMQDVAAAMNARDWVVGLSYWTVIGGANEDILTSDTIAPKGAYYALQETYGGFTDVSVPVDVLGLSLGLQNPAVNVAAGAAPGTAALSLTLPAPTVSATSTASVAPLSQALTLSLPAPTVVTTSAVAVAGGTQTLILTPLAPAVNTTRAIVVVPVAQNLLLGLPTPSVGTGSSIAVSSPPQALTLTPLAPTVQAQRHATIAAGLLALTMQAPTALVGTGASSTATPGTQAVTVNILAPTVATQWQATVAPPALALTASLLSPTLSTNAWATIGATGISLLLRLYVPTVRTNAGRRPMVTPRPPLIVQYGSRLVVGKKPPLVVR